MKEFMDSYNTRPIQEFAGGIKKLCYPLPTNWVDLTKDVTTPFNIAWWVFVDYIALLIGYTLIYSAIILITLGLAGKMLAFVGSKIHKY